MAKILIVDDERGIVDMIQSYFQTQYDILTAYSGQEALKKVVCKPDLILLDINMPGMDGLTVCQQIREHIACPILFLTARIESSDKIIGFQAGADDYIVKPFEIVTLLVRIERVLARTGRLNQVYRFRDLTLDAENRTLTYAGEPIDLPPLEFDVLAVLMKNKNRTVSRERILNEIWGEDYFGDIRTVDVRVANLRKKLNLSEAIRTISKAGYRLEELRK